MMYPPPEYAPHPHYAAHPGAPPPGHDPYAAHYGHPPPASYPPPQASYYPPPGAEVGHHPPPAAYPPQDPYAGHHPPAAYGHPPPSTGHYPPPGYGHQPPPGYPGGHPPPNPADGQLVPHGHHLADPYGGHPPPGHYAGHHAPPGYAYGHPPPAYGAPPAYGMPPGMPYGMPAPGYGPPPGSYGFHGAPPPPGMMSRGMSPRRGQKRLDGKGGNNNKQGPGKKANNTPMRQLDQKERMTKWLQAKPDWTALWLEGIDPPKRLASTPNVTVCLVSRQQGDEFGFYLTSSRLASGKKKDREKDCSNIFMHAVDQMPIEEMKGWCQLPVASSEKKDVEIADMDRLTTAVKKKCPKSTVEIPEPAAYVLVAAMPVLDGVKAAGPDPEFAVLDKFDAGFGEQLAEARRVSGLVRKQWFVANVLVKPGDSSKPDLRPFTLGIGMATDRALARARALYAAEARVSILTDSMFKVPKEKVTPLPAAEQKALPAPVPA